MVDLIIVAMLKVAEHSFQVPMPNSPLLLNYFWRPSFARLKVDHRRGYSRILVQVRAAMAAGLVKNKA